MDLDRGAIAPYVSAYLLGGGVQRDVPDIDRVTIAGKHVEATCHMKEYFSSPHDGTFHLSGVVGSTLLVQLGIIHGLILEGHERKDCEIFLSELRVKCKKEISATEGLRLAMDLTHRLVLPANEESSGPRAFCTWRFDVDEGAWDGRLTLMLPVVEGLDDA